MCDTTDVSDGVREDAEEVPQHLPEDLAHLDVLLPLADTELDTEAACNLYLLPDN